MLHLFGEERGAVDLEHAQHALHLVQLLLAALEQRQVLGLLDVVLERRASLAQRRIQLAADEFKRL